MNPRFSGTKLEWREIFPAEAEYYDIVEIQSLSEVAAYAEECKRHTEFTSTYRHIPIRPPVAVLNVSNCEVGEGVDEDITTWMLNKIATVYVHGGSILAILAFDTTGLKPEKEKCSIALALIQLICKLSLKYSQPCVNISLKGLCRTDQQLNESFPEMVASASAGPLSTNIPIGRICKSLDLGNNKLRDKQTEQVIRSLCQWNTVVDLRMDSNCIGAKACDTLCEWLANPLCSLRFLSLQDCGIFSDRNFKPFGNKNKSADSACARTFAERIAEALGHGMTLQVLGFGTIPYTFSESGAMEKCLTALRRNHALKTLTLTNGKISLTTSHVMQISSMMQSNCLHQLVNLNLSFCSLLNASVAVLCASLCENDCKVISLNLAANEFTDVSPLFPLVRDKLQWLDLSGNRFDKDLRSMSEIPPATDIDMTDAERDLYDARYAASGSMRFSLLLGKIARSKSLRHLNLDNCQLGASSIIVLFSQLAMRWAQCTPADIPKDHGKAITGENATVLSFLSLNDNPLGLRGVTYLHHIMSKYFLVHSLRHLRLSKTLGGSAYTPFFTDFLQKDCRLVHVEVSDYEIRMANVHVHVNVDMLLNTGIAGLIDMSDNYSLYRPIVTTLSIPLGVRVAFISAIRNPRNGRLSLPRDAIHSILQFLRTPVIRTIEYTKP